MSLCIKARDIKGRGLKNESFDSRSLVVGRTWCHGVGAEFREDRGGDIPAVDGFQRCRPNS